jgi:chromosome segregation ATPase
MNTGVVIEAGTSAIPPSRRTLSVRQLNRLAALCRNAAALNGANRHLSKSLDDLRDAKFAHTRSVDEARRNLAAVESQYRRRFDDEDARTAIDQARTKLETAESTLTRVRQEMDSLMAQQTETVMRYRSLVDVADAVRARTGQTYSALGCVNP